MFKVYKCNLQLRKAPQDSYPVATERSCPHQVLVVKCSVSISPDSNGLLSSYKYCNGYSHVTNYIEVAQALLIDPSVSNPYRYMIPKFNSS